MKRHKWKLALCFAAVIAIASHSLRAQKGAQEIRNVLFISADDHAAYAIGAYGNKVIRTPNIDKLASQGTLFRHAYANSPICTVSRQSIITGKYPHATGVTLLSTALSDSQTTIADHVRTRGFKTAAIGKMHFNSKSKHGFDYRIDGEDHDTYLAGHPARKPAQLIDGSLGMAYGVTASTLLLSFGVPPAAASATVHAAECLTTGTSALSHHAFGNVDGYLFRRLLIPGVLGAGSGAYLLSSFPGDALRPYISGYLIIMGAVIIVKAFGEFPPKNVTTHLVPLGFIGAFLDAVGGGGWGPIVASNLIFRGNNVRQTVGSVNAVEFFVTLAASVTFVLTLGLSHWHIILGLALGGVGAAPIGAWACKHLPVKPFMVFVGVLVIVISARTLLLNFQ